MADNITAPKFSAIAANCLPALKNSTRWLRAAATNFSGDFGKLNQTLNVIAAGTPDAAREFSHTTGYGSTDGKLLTTAVSLTSRLFSENTMEDAEFASLNDSTLTELIKASVNSVSAGVEKFVAGKILSDVVTNSVEVDAENFAASNLNALRRKVVSMSLPAEAVAAVFNPVLYTGLITDEKIARSTVASVAENALVQGKVARVAGWDVYEAAALPDNGESLCGLVLHPSALAVAARPVYTPGADLFEILLDEDSGFAISLKVVSDPIHALVSIVAETFVGAEVVLPDAILRITESA